MRLILAARLSRIAPGQTGIDTQDIDAREWAEAEGHTIVATVADRKSGTLAMWERPNLKPWVTEQSYMALYDGIVAAKQDRLSRADWRDEAELRIWAENNEKTLFIVDRDLRWPPREGAHHEDDVSNWNRGAEEAHREWANTSRRYKRMQKALRDQKFFVGKKTFGYRIIGSGDHKTLEPDPEQKPIVQEMARRYLDGQSFSQIRDWLIAEDVPTMQNGTRGWSAQAVRRILSNPVITGRVMVHGRTYLRVPELISYEDFTSIQEMVKGRATRGKTTEDRAMLTSLIFCDQGHPMYRIHGRKVPSNPDGQYYYCSPELAPKGQRYLVPLAFAHEQVNEAVMKYGWAPHYRIEMTPGEEYSNEVAQVKQDIAELDPEANDYDEKLTALREELKRLRKLPSKPPERKAVPDGKKVSDVWPKLTNQQKRQWLLDRGWRVIVFRRDEGYWLIVEPGEFLADIEALQQLQP